MFKTTTEFDNKNFKESSRNLEFSTRTDVEICIMQYRINSTATYSEICLFL